MDRRVDVGLQGAGLGLDLPQLQVDVVDPGAHGDFLAADYGGREVDDRLQPLLDPDGAVERALLPPDQGRHDHDRDEEDDDQQEENRELLGADHETPPKRFFPVLLFESRRLGEGLWDRVSASPQEPDACQHNAPVAGS